MNGRPAPTSLLLLALAAAPGLAAGCGTETSPAPPAPTDAPTNTPDLGPTNGSTATPSLDRAKPRPRAPTREGGAIVRSPHDDALYLADEDHAVLRRIPLPVDVHAPPSVIPLPGRPAQVLALADRLLVTIRDPSLLLLLEPQPGGAAREIARVALPDDAWGVAVSPDERTAFVSSAWGHRVSAIDIESAIESAIESPSPRWSVSLPREPRGLAVTSDGSGVYVTHLTGTAITKIEGIKGDAPTVAAIELPAAPLRTRWGERAGASLGYAAALSPDGSRLFVARHALGALGPDAWFGAATVDVLATRDDTPVAPRRKSPRIGTLTENQLGQTTLEDPAGSLPTTSVTPFVQPRAMVYRASTSTLLVASEGDNTLVELDALSVAPALQPLRTYPLGGGHADELPIASTCAAPSGIALSADESMAYVFCRSTYDLAIVTLDAHDATKPFQHGPLPFVHLADDPLPAQAALGRRLYYDATDSQVSGGLGCAGCHPDGRDDGFVWHELPGGPLSSGPIFAGSPFVVDASGADHKGLARQTPMLAGRVAAAGPYGWHAESPSLRARLVAGFGLHRWSSRFEEKNADRLRADALAAFLREGLVPPPRTERPLTPEEERGKALFLAESTQCAACHVPQSEFTDRTAVPLRRLPTPRGYDDDPNPAFKVPSLLFVGGTEPYFHDGHAATLDDVVNLNNDRMGKTNHLTREDRAALVSFLRTL